jgi:hypothetical protein
MENTINGSVSSKFLLDAEKDDLTRLAGLWSANLHVTISFPAVVTQGPLCRNDARPKRELRLPI